MRMNYSSRFWLYAPLALFLGLAGWAMAYWWVVATALDKKLDALNGHEAVPGITLSYATKTISGFPFNIDVVFTGFKVEGAGAHGHFAWQSERFALHALTYGAVRQIYEMAGQQSLSWQDGSGKPHRITFLPASMHASADIECQGPQPLRSRYHGRRRQGQRRCGLHDRAGPVPSCGTIPRRNAVDMMVSADQAQNLRPLLQQPQRLFDTVARCGVWRRCWRAQQSWPQASQPGARAGGARQSRASSGRRWHGYLGC